MSQLWPYFLGPYTATTKEGRNTSSELVIMCNASITILSSKFLGHSLVTHAVTWIKISCYFSALPWQSTTELRNTLSHNVVGKEPIQQSKMWDSYSDRRDLAETRPCAQEDADTLPGARKSSLLLAWITVSPPALPCWMHTSASKGKRPHSGFINSLSYGKEDGVTLDFCLQVCDFPFSLSNVHTMEWAH